MEAVPTKADRPRQETLHEAGLATAKPEHVSSVFYISSAPDAKARLGIQPRGRLIGDPERALDGAATATHNAWALSAFANYGSGRKQGLTGSKCQHDEGEVAPPGQGDPNADGNSSRGAERMAGAGEVVVVHRCPPMGAALARRAGEPGLYGVPWAAADAGTMICAAVGACLHAAAGLSVVPCPGNGATRREAEPTGGAGWTKNFCLPLSVPVA